MRRLWLGCLAALVVSGPAVAAPQLEKELIAIGQGMEAGKCDVGRIRKLLARPDFEQLGGRGRSLAWTALAMCDDAARHDSVVKATAEPEALALAWSLRFVDAAIRDDASDAVSALHEAVERKNDGSIAWFGDDYVYRVGRNLRSDPDGFQRLMAELDQADWKTQTPYYGGDWLWSRYAGLLARTGDLTHAWRIASKVQDPGEMARMSVDQRFDNIIAIEPSRFDVTAAAERKILRAREFLGRKPRDGSALAEMTRMLRFLGRQQEALDLLDSVIATPGPILDYRGQDHRNWIFNDRALVLIELGRTDEAVAAMQTAAGHREQGGDNVSQTINLAGLQNSAGRFEAALVTLAAFDAAAASNTSAYGAMWVQAERACALIGLGRAAEAEKAIAQTAEHAKDNWQARSKALLCARDLDGLATAYKLRLAAEDDRTDALLELSRFRPLSKSPALALELGARMEAIRRRPDVQAAIAKVGRVRDFPIQSGDLIDAY